MSKQIFTFWLCLLVLCVPCLRAQTQGEITGEVTDGSGAVIPGAAVVATNENTNVSRQTVTNDSGVYSFPALLPGVYQVRVEKGGFQSVLRAKIELQIQQVARIDFRLQVGQASETVSVVAETALLATENATTGTVIENRRIVDLPLNGRNFLQLVSLAPNVSYGFGTAGQQVGIQGGQRSQQTISVSGQRSEFNHFTLDGIENTDQNFNSYVFLPSVDALEEFKVQTGVYPAEFGTATSQINVSTKAGTNAYHGTLFEFFRNAKLDAQPFRFVSTATAKNPFVRNQYGFTLGGPIQIPKIFNGKNRLFFMANYEALRDRTGGTRISDVPSVAMRGGDFTGATTATGTRQTLYDPATRTQQGNSIVASVFPGNVIPQSRFNGRAVKLLEFYPSPNVAGATLLARNYQVNRVRSQDSDQFNARADFAENSNSTWFGRWSWGSEGDIQPGNVIGTGGTKLGTDVQQAMISNTRIFGPRVVNEFRFGYNRFSNTQAQENAYVRNIVGELGGIPGVAVPTPVLWGAPNITITGFSGFGDSGTSPNITRNNTFQWIDNLSVNRSLHSLRFGAEIRRDRVNQSGNQFPRGDFAFSGQATQNPVAPANTGNGFADYLLGLIRSDSGSLGLAVAQLRAWREFYYIDDTWKIRRNLTLSIGLRYEYSPPYVSKHGGLINTDISAPFDPAHHPTIVRAGSGDFYEGMPFRFQPTVQIARDGRLGDALVRKDLNDFAPRVGLSYNPSPTWSIRAGWGAFFVQDIGNARYDMSRNLAARRSETASSNFPNLTLDAPFANLGTVFVDYPLILSNHVDRRTPYVFQYLLNIQHELKKNMVLEVGYTGNEGHKLERFRLYNIATPGPGDVQARRPYPELGAIQEIDGVVNANYNSLAAKFTERFGSAINLMVSYTYSKAIDLGSAIRTHGGDADFAQNNYDIKGTARGVSNFDQQQRFVTSLLWEPPIGKGKKWLSHGVTSYVLGNWQLGNIVTYRTGLPYSMANGTDDANIGGPGGQLPNRTSAPLDPPSGHKDPTMYFNPAAFSRILPYTFGNVGRNTMRGPEAFSWDFSTAKKFQMPIEGHELQFRFEAFNFPNRPNFGLPSASLSSNSFSQITSTQTLMRQLQFSLKYRF